MNRVYIFTVK